MGLQERSRTFQERGKRAGERVGQRRRWGHTRTPFKRAVPSLWEQDQLYDTRRQKLMLRTAVCSQI